MTPSVYVLVAASRSDHLRRGAARTWLEGALAGAEAVATFTLMPVLLASVLRPVTSPKTLLQPTPIADALDFVDACWPCPGCA